MPYTNKASAPVSVDIPRFEGRYVDLGGYTVGFAAWEAARAAVRHWIRYFDGTPVAAAASHAAHGVANLCLAATLPAARRRGVWRTLVMARCADTPDLPAVAFTSDYSRPGFLRMGFLPITRFTLWAVVA